MDRIYRRIISHRKAVIVLFLLLFAISLVTKNLVAVNYDMKDYLPEDTASTVSLEVLQTEFGEGIPNARVMIENVTVPEALEYKEKLLKVDGVRDVTWLDDSVDILTPLNEIDSDILGNYYRDDAALFSVTIEENKRISAVADIREIIGDDNAMTGNAVSSALGTVNTVKEIRKIAGFSVLFVIFLLLVTTTSWIEPFIILAGLGAAIMINNGTNFIFGEISFVTNAAGSILQLAVSLDYSVFLMHRFRECRKETDNPEDAMTDALCKSTGSILSSGITTVIGFMALVLMKFRLGPDLGLALAKGVSISLVTVFVFTPCLALLFYRIMDRTQHRYFMPSFAGMGTFIRRISLPMVIIFALVIVPSYRASCSGEFLYGSSDLFGKDTVYGQDREAIENLYGERDTYVLLVPVGDGQSEKELSEEILAMPDVSSVISYAHTVGIQVPEEYLDEHTLRLLRSDNYSRIVISADVPYEGDRAFGLIEDIRAAADKYYPDNTYLAGEGVSSLDLKNTVTKDMTEVNLIAVAAVFLVLLLMMKNIGIPVILVLSIETAIWLNIAVPYFAGKEIFYIAYLIISTVQLGATVDYAILFTDRYKENRQKLDKRESVVQTVSDVTVSVLTSGSALTVVGLLLGRFSSHQLLAQLGIFLGRGALFSLFIVLFVLPGILMMFDRFVMGRNRIISLTGGIKREEK